MQIIQSMSKAGYPYDNAVMERYFNALKNECTNLYEFQTEEIMYRTVEEFAYVIYNHMRPHSYNNYHPIRLELYRFYFLVTSVTKMLDHYSRIQIQAGFGYF